MNEIILDRLSNLSHTAAAEALALEKQEEGPDDQEKSLGQVGFEAYRGDRGDLSWMPEFSELERSVQENWEAAAQAVAARVREECADFFRPRHIDEWHEDMGDVLWWTNPVTEPPYLGSLLSCGMAIEMSHYVGGEGEVKTLRTFVGGWPGYHEWWTPLPDCKVIAAALPKPKESAS